MVRFALRLCCVVVVLGVWFPRVGLVVWFMDTGWFRWVMICLWCFGWV